MNTPEIFKDYKTLTFSTITTGANTTAYHIWQTQGAEDGQDAEYIKKIINWAVKALCTNMANALQWHFNGEKQFYFHQSDKHKNIEGDAYVRYAITGESVEIWIGGDNGEVCALVTQSPAAVDCFLSLIKNNSPVS
jgi:hypothetical protein